MLIDLSDVFNLDGKEASWEVPLELKEFRTGGNVYPVVSDEPVKITVQNLGNRKFELSGETQVTLKIPCARCLKPVEYTCGLTFDEELDMSVSGEGRTEGSEEQAFLSGYQLDADRLVCEGIALELPMRVLCREDCKGLCGKCGKDLNEGSCGCDTASVDPRMARIQDIFNQFKEG